MSQGSGSFVAATQGDLTSMVREIQRGLADIQHQGAAVMAGWTRSTWTSRSPCGIERKRTYLPSKEIGGRRELQVSYGAGAGLDRLTTDTRMLNYYSAGIAPGRRVLMEADFVDDPDTWLNERQDEELERVTLQRFAGDPTTSLDFLMVVLQKKRSEGLDFVDAYGDHGGDGQHAARTGRRPAQGHQPRPAAAHAGRGSAPGRRAHRTCRRRTGHPRPVQSPAAPAGLRQVGGTMTEPKKVAKPKVVTVTDEDQATPD